MSKYTLLIFVVYALMASGLCIVPSSCLKFLTSHVNNGAVLVSFSHMRTSMEQNMAWLGATPSVLSRYPALSSSFDRPPPVGPGTFLISDR